MNGFLAIAWRDVRLAWTGGGLWLPIVFYLTVATLFPFAAGPDKALLARVGGSILWIAALLASLLPIERLVLPDRQAGVLDQLYLRGWADEWIAAAKIAGHITGFGPARRTRRAGRHSGARPCACASRLCRPWRNDCRADRRVEWGVRAWRIAAGSACDTYPDLRRRDARP
jgi:hypothetical protein